MSTIVSFMPMNVRLYDRDERELRTYVSPEFSCVEDPFDERGMSCHIVADNGGGKSTLLLFFEMLFCKPDRNGPSVGHKKAIDYLRRARMELGDATPTSMAALVRRDDPSLMRGARDVIFGYSVGLRGSDGASLDLRRFVIHLEENPGFTLDALARDYIFDTKGAPRQLRDVWERLRELPGCHLYESVEWDDYAREMIEAGVNPTLWRELARMNQDEEAAGDYFASGDAFRKIVNLVSESLEPTSGERRKPLAETAATIARQVSTQTEDRARERASVEAAEAVSELAQEVSAYAQAREDLRTVEDEARLVRDVLDDECRELDEIIDKLEGAAAGYRERRRQNDCLNVSATIRRRAREIEVTQEGADALKRDSDEKEEIARSAERAVMIEDAARTRRTYLKLDAEIRAQRDAVAVLEGKMERDEELARARGRAWAGAEAVTRISNEREKAAEEALEGASRAEEAAAQALDEADASLQERMLALGQAQERADGALARLAELAEGVEGLESAPVTLRGLYAEASLSSLSRGAEAALRERTGALEEAQKALEAAEARLTEAQGERRDAEIAAIGAEAEAEVWTKNLEMVREQEGVLRDAVALFEDVRTLVVEGRYEEAAEATNTLRTNLEGDARDEDELVRTIESRLRALDEGRLDTTEGLRAWLDRHGIRAVTLGGYKGIPEATRDTIFGVSPWLAHALVVDEGALKALGRVADEGELTELGHAVFYVRQRDVADLVEVATAGPGLPSARDGHQLVRALGTVDATSLMDPKRFKAELAARVERAKAAADQARMMAGKLLAARDLIVAFSRTLETIGMQPGATTADVAERARNAGQARDAARRRLDEATAAVTLSEAILEEARAALVRAREALEHATQQLRAIRALVEQNGRAEEAVGALERAQEQERGSRAAKKAAEAAYGNARTTRRVCAEEYDKARRELQRVREIVSRIEALGTRPAEEELYREEAPTTVSELEQAVGALDVLQSRISEDLHEATDKLHSLQIRQSENEQWRHDIEQARARGIVFSVEDLDACVPTERFEYQRMRSRMIDAIADRKIAGDAYRDALNELRVLDLQQKSSYADLAAFGLTEPLDVPEGYDFSAEAAQIDADEKSDLETLAISRDERDELAQLAAQAGLASERANQQDGYRASRVATAPTFADMAARRAAVASLTERQRTGLSALLAAAGDLETKGERARLATEEAQERHAARNIADSVRTLREDCTSKSAMMKIGLELEDRSQMLRSMALTLQNRLRATDESVGDIVEQAVEEGYKLTTELFHLSRISRASIKGSRPQRTIDFRSRGRTVFAEEFRRDDVATERLKRHVRDLIMEELPALEDSRRLERAEARLAAPELVYLLLDDRSVDVRYPVIRGGARLSYESTRDAAGSGSTGQKSAGYVLSFLALLRYLGNVGALSKENSLFVALENQFGKISSTSIIADIKEVVDQTHMQLITVAGRELRSSYAMGDVVYALYRTQGSESSAKRSVSAMRARRGDDEEPIHDSIIDRFRATRRFENLSFDI